MSHDNYNVIERDGHMIESASEMAARGDLSIGERQAMLVGKARRVFIL
jgi:hypothetical protein